MGFLDELKKLAKPYDDDEEDYLDDVGAPEQSARQRSRSIPFSNYGAAQQDATPAAKPQQPKPVRPKEGKVVSLGGGDRQTQVVLIKPEQFETAAEVADHLRSNHAVLLNLEAAPKDLTRRMVDFLSGVTYAMDGNIRRVASNTYIITPANVNLIGDQLEELESGNMYF